MARSASAGLLVDVLLVLARWSGGLAVPRTRDLRWRPRCCNALGRSAALVLLGPGSTFGVWAAWWWWSRYYRRIP